MKILYLNKIITKRKKMKTVAQKMGIKENDQSHFVNASKDAIDAMNLPEIQVSKTLNGEFDYLHLFVKNKADKKKFFRN